MAIKTVGKKNGPNREQQRVINHTEGPILVIAGPGSGKTFTLVERILHIIKTKNVKPENLLVATFTEKAAKELVTRISNRLLETLFSKEETATAICNIYSENGFDFLRDIENKYV